MRKTYVICSGASVAPRRETLWSATKALELVIEYMRQRLPNVTIENGDGEQLSYFQLRDLAKAEGRKENAYRT